MPVTSYRRSLRGWVVLATLVLCIGVHAQGVANYEGLWWAAPAGAEAGWGINIAHQGDAIFATWFTYDANGKAWWLSATANKTAAGVYGGTLYQTSGPAFNSVPFDPKQVTRTAVGTATLTFSSTSTGTFAYTVNGITQTKAIALQVFGPLPICTWSAQPNFALATNYQDLWWAAPSGAESGWGVNLIHQGNTIFATWFTYDANRNPLWYSVTAPQVAANTFSGSLVQTSGPAFSAVPFDPTKVQRTTVGSSTFNFTDGNTGTFAYIVNGVTQTKNITRELFQPPAGTLCRQEPTTVSVSGVNLIRRGVVWNPHGAQIIAFVAPPAAQTSVFAAASAHYSTAEISAVQAWGADTVRFQVSQPGLDPQSALYTSSFLGQVQAAVTYARSIGLNVIICVQDEVQSGETTPATLPNAATQRVWQTLAPLFNADTGILYEIMNEPSLTPSTANWSAWQTAMNAVIATIRATGSRNVVIADGLNFAEVLNGAPLLTDSLSQVAYAAHPYFKSGFASNTFPTAFGNFASNAPVIVTEWDLSQNQFCDSTTPALALTMLQYLLTRNIGIVGYAYDNPGLVGRDYGTSGSIVQDFNGTPTTLSNNISCGALGFGPGTLLQNYFRTGTVAMELQ